MDRLEENQLTFSVSARKDAPEREYLFGRLREWTKETARQWQQSEQEHWLTVTARDEQGRIVGGLYGDAFLGCFYLRIFWVEQDYRGRGLGAQLLRGLERQAQQLGCTVMCLDTFDFQAEGFYQKHGYERAGAVEYFDGGPVKIFMKKNLV